MPNLQDEVMKDVSNTEIARWYAALRARDARFDGRLFVGVSSTGVYCRPICRARLPKRENCTFFATAAAAEQAGFRPCLTCRPELAPGSRAPVDATGSLARRTARMLATDCGSRVSIADVARRLGYSERHLRRTFVDEYGVSPMQYLQTCRLLLAKNLLTDTRLPVIDVAMAAGFGSLRRFNDLFKRRYRLTPTTLRRQAASDGTQPGEVTLALGYRPPYRWKEMLEFLALRAVPSMEIVNGSEYARTVRLVTSEGREVTGWIRVGHRPEKNVLTVTLSDTLLPALPQVLARVGDLFDVQCDPEAVYDTLAVMNRLRPGLCTRGTRLPGCFEPFEMAMRAVLGQQVTVRAARTLAGRLVEAHGVPVTTGIEGLTHAFPAPDRIAGLDGDIGDHLGPLGITGARAKTILRLARATLAGEIDLGRSADPEAETRKLMALNGVGPWTAGYIAMRALGWPDSFLPTDHGVKQALKPRDPSEIAALAEAWRPWRSYAVVNLWNSLPQEPEAKEQP